MRQFEFSKDPFVIRASAPSGCKTKGQVKDMRRPGMRFGAYFSRRMKAPECLLGAKTASAARRKS